MPVRHCLARKRQITTGVRHLGCAADPDPENPALLAVGERGLDAGRPSLTALRADGSICWQDRFAEEPGEFTIGAEPHCISLPSQAAIPAVAQFISHRAEERPGLLRLLARADGRELWRAETGSVFSGNRDCAVLDLDGDGDLELLAGYADRLVCYRCRDGAQLWERRERIGICWGRSAIGDLNGDGRNEIVLGSEYANPDQTSSVCALRCDGSLLWEYAGIPGDCGSTPTCIQDVNGDGRPEILKVEIDLECRGAGPGSRLWCFRADGTLLWRCGLGGKEISIADFDGDGALEALCVTDARDGGKDAVPALRCVDLRQGTLRWSLPLPRFYLAGWPAAARDVDGDGLPEAILPHGNPGGYGRRAGESPWGEILIVRGDGTVLQTLSFPDFVLCPLWFDWDRDGETELLAPCADGTVAVYGRGAA